jgi:hypothetical protein
VRLANVVTPVPVKLMPLEAVNASDTSQEDAFQAINSRCARMVTRAWVTLRDTCENA